MTELTAERLEEIRKLADLPSHFPVEDQQVNIIMAQMQRDRRDLLAALNAERAKNNALLAALDEARDDLATFLKLLDEGVTAEAMLITEQANPHCSFLREVREHLSRTPTEALETREKERAVVKRWAQTKPPVEHVIVDGRPAVRFEGLQPAEIELLETLETRATGTDLCQL